MLEHGVRDLFEKWLVGGMLIRDLRVFLKQV